MGGVACFLCGVLLADVYIAGNMFIQVGCLRVAALAIESLTSDLYTTEVL